VPSAVTPSQQFTASIKLKNTGTSIWYNDSYKLGSSNQTWGKYRVNLNSQEIVLPGSTKTFSFALTAPSSPGIYNFQWRMIRGAEEWFGDTFQKNIEVKEYQVTTTTQPEETSIASTTSTSTSSTSTSTSIPPSTTNTQTNFGLPKIDPLLIIVGILAIAVPIVFILIVTKI